METKTSKKETFHVCPLCNREINFTKYDVWNCETCNLDLENAFYSWKFATFNLEQWKEDNDLTESDIDQDTYYDSDKYNTRRSGLGPDSNGITTFLDKLGPDEFTLNTNLCCNKEPSSCICSEQWTFMDAYKSVFDERCNPKNELDDYAYLIDTDFGSIPCHSCLYYGTYQCHPFREWIQDRLIEGDYFLEELSVLDGTVEPCQHYTPKPTATKEQVAGVNHYLESMYDWYDDEDFGNEDIGINFESND